jgi:hypothetical protein
VQAFHVKGWWSVEYRDLVKDSNPYGDIGGYPRAAMEQPVLRILEP